jgi:hypothetical protein
MNEIVDIYLGENIIIIGPPSIVSNYIREKLTFQNPEYLEIIKRKKMKKRS